MCRKSVNLDTQSEFNQAGHRNLGRRQMRENEMDPINNPVAMSQEASHDSTPTKNRVSYESGTLTGGGTGALRDPSTTDNLTQGNTSTAELGRDTGLWVPGSRTSSNPESLPWSLEPFNPCENTPGHEIDGAVKQLKHELADRHLQVHELMAEGSFSSVYRGADRARLHPAASMPVRVNTARIGG